MVYVAERQPTNVFGAYWESKSVPVVAAVFVNFPKKKCNFLHKNKLDIVRRVQFFTAAPYEEFSSWGSRHHCPVEVGAYGPKIYFSLVLSCAWLTSREDNHASEFRAAPHCSETVIRLCTECLQGAQKL